VKLPKCMGYKSWTDYGYEYDCETVHEEGCEECLSLYKKYGGRWHPVTGKKLSKLAALLLYGLPGRPDAEGGKG
jgi:hypothetical protein